MQGTTAYEIHCAERNYERLCFGVPAIDKVVPSILCTGITEISGQAGSGKTQMCLHLALRCQIDMENASVAYMSCGEGDFPVRRLSQMAKAMTEQSPTRNEYELLNNIYIEKVDHFEHLQDSIVSYLNWFEYILICIV